MKFHLLIEILKSLGRIETDIHRTEVKMAAIDDKLAALVAAVQRTSTDVQTILAKLTSTGLTPEQTAILDSATAALGTLDDTMEAAATAAAAHKAGPKH